METTAQLLYRTLPKKYFKNHYDPHKQLHTNTSYMFNYGGRDIGKTFAWAVVMLWAWQKHDIKSCYMRRMADNIKGVKCANFFDKVFSTFPDMNVKKYDGIGFRGGQFKGYWIDQKGKKVFDVPFCYTYALASAVENNKGVLDIENLGVVFFDECLTADTYLTDEWNRFQNGISTIIRENEQAFVVLSANTVSWNAPYFRQFGIYDPKKIKQGSIVVLPQFDETSVSVEYCKDGYGSEKKSNVDKRFFSFIEGKNEMITNGAWEVRPCQQWQSYHRKDDSGRYYSREKILTVYMKYEFEYVAIEILEHEYLGVVANVRPCYDFDTLTDDMVLRLYTDDFITRPYEVQRIKGDRLDKLIFTLYKDGKFFYTDNVCGEVVRRWVESGRKF